MFLSRRRRSTSQFDRHLTAGVSPCESRQLLAGNVTVSFTGPNSILIQGDGADNQIEYISDPYSGSIIIQGYDGTTVNGTPISGMNQVLLTNPQGQIYQGGRLPVGHRGPGSGK